MDNVVYETINGTNERYRWTRYLNVTVIEDTLNGYINATKMCSMYGTSKNGNPKHFYNWKNQNASFINYVAPCTELMYALSHGLDTIKGTYINRDLAVHLAIWCDLEFGYKVSRIINSEIKMQIQKLQ